MDFWETLHKLDQQLTLAINNLHSPWSDQIMIWFSDIPVWIPLYAVILFFLFRNLGWKKATVVTISAVLTFAACDQFSNLIKDATERLRPCHDLFMVDSGLRILEGKGGRFGFFSAHSANAFGFALCTLIGFLNDERPEYKYRTYGILMFTWAFFVAISRVFVGKHYLGDILVGALVGLVFGYCFGQLAKYAIGRFIAEDSVSSPE